MLGPFRRRRRRARGVSPCRQGRGPRPLSECAQDEVCRVVSNPDRKTLEMGFHTDAVVHVWKNAADDANMVVGVRDARYVLSKQAAVHILVC